VPAIAAPTDEGPARPVARPRGWFLLAVASTLVGLFFASQAMSNPAVRDMIGWRKALAINLTYYWLWGAAVPLVVALARRFPFEARRWPRALLVHVLGSVAVTAVVIVGTELLLTFALDVRREPFSYDLPMAFRANFHSLVPTYWMILVGWLAIEASARARERDLRASQLETRLAEARLQALRMQLQPHFLFNTLNSISSLMYSDVEAADSMMARLAELLRLTLEEGSAPEVPLQRELELLDRYLGIERIRFEERLRVTVEVEEAARGVLVPALLLQPLVENALRHGIDRRPEGGRVSVDARRDGGRLVLRIANDGPRATSDGNGMHGTRVGLANTRERLAQLHGERAALRLEERADGAVVTVELPWRTADEAAGADRGRRAAGAAEALDPAGAAR